MTGASGRTLRPEAIAEVVGKLLRTNPSVLGTDIAVVAVRVVLVWIFTYYGAGKLFGWFGGPGIHRAAIFFASTAHLHPGTLFAAIAGIIEFGAAMALAVGLLSRLAALALFGDQVVAMSTVTWIHGLNSSSTSSGYEFNLTLAAMAVVIIGLGAGRLSLDAVIGRHVRDSRRSEPLAAARGVGEREGRHMP